MPVLTTLVFLPLLGGIAVLATGRGRDALARQLALVVSLVNTSRRLIERGRRMLEPRFAR